MEAVDIAKNAVQILDKKKAVDISMIEITEKSILSDYFVIAGGTSSTHVKSLADELEYELEKLGVTPDHIEGRATGWILLDYGSVIFHIFTKESRDFYNLERLWADANMVDISSLLTE
ncbi:MAG: ribosome silencing factor [Clostridia bacterium]|nr:ribosome silencing factor [Clostridia bacterium]